MAERELVDDLTVDETIVPVEIELPGEDDSPRPVVACEVTLGL